MSFTDDKDSDNYATDKKGWEIIEPYIPKDKKIWAPFYCDGKQKEYFEEMGYDIIHQDKDFFSYTPEYDIIIDNPPFSKIKDISIKLKELDKPFILILPVSTITKQFVKVLERDKIQMIIPSKRMQFEKAGVELSRCYFDCCYLCYKMELEHDITFI